MPVRRRRIPAPGGTGADTFTVLTAANGLNGAFSNVANGARLFLADGSFLVNYGPNSVVLSNFEAIPEPSTYALLGLGAVVVLLRLRKQKQARLQVS